MWATLTNFLIVLLFKFRLIVVLFCQKNKFEFSLIHMYIMYIKNLGNYVEVKEVKKFRRNILDSLVYLRKLANSFFNV